MRRGSRGHGRRHGAQTTPCTRCAHKALGRPYPQTVCLFVCVTRSRHHYVALEKQTLPPARVWASRRQTPPAGSAERSLVTSGARAASRLGRRRGRSCCIALGGATPIRHPRPPHGRGANCALSLPAPVSARPGCPCALRAPAPSLALRVASLSAVR
jgi:hypothetical protein